MVGVVSRRASVKLYSVTVDAVRAVPAPGGAELSFRVSVPVLGANVAELLAKLGRLGSSGSADVVVESAQFEMEVS